MGGRYFINSGRDMREFIDYVGHPLFHGCWDTGHANCEGAQYEEILALASDPAVFFASLYMILDIVILAAGVVLFFKNRRRIFVSDRCEVCIPKEKRGSVIVGNAGVIAFLTITGLLMIVNILFS